MSRDITIKYLTAILSMLAAIVTIIAYLFLEGGLIAKSIDQERLFFVILGIATLGTAFTSLTMITLINRRRTMERVRRVFIIYSRKDLSVAKEISEVLKSKGLNPWLDVENIAAGEIWRDEISQALDESAMAIAILSKNFKSDSHAAKELRTAVSNLESRDKKASPLIPVLVDDSDIPKSISHIHFVDYTSDSAQEFLVKSIEQAMNRILGSH